MATLTRSTNAQPRALPRSVAAVLLGLISIFILSLGTDQLFHALGVYPPWGEPMFEPGLNLLALSYRIVFAVVGSYIAASFAPHSPMAHALALGAVGVLLSVAGAIAMWGLGPNWFPVSLVLISMPAAWLGGALHRGRHTAR